MHRSPMELSGVKIFEVPEQGAELRTGGDAVEIMSAARGQSAALILIPVQRFGDDFFDLRTQIAGEIVQKFSTYGACVAILGDICQRIAHSKSFAAFVSETNRGDRLWFVESLEELKERLFEQRFRTPSQ